MQHSCVLPAAFGHCHSGPPLKPQPDGLLGLREFERVLCLDHHYQHTSELSIPEPWPRRLVYVKGSMQARCRLDAARCYSMQQRLDASMQRLARSGSAARHHSASHRIDPISLRGVQRGSGRQAYDKVRFYRLYCVLPRAKPRCD